MTANEIFKRLVNDPFLKEEYGLTEDVLKQIELHNSTDSDILEILRIVILGVQNDTPKSSIYSQIKTHFNL
ncbi:hypothetical protein [Reichenbachiella sp.]